MTTGIAAAGRHTASLPPLPDAAVLSRTTSLCAICKNGIDAEIIETDAGIYMRKSCPEHGRQDVLIASDAAWYREVMAYPAELAPPQATRAVANGCPYDCGACSSHQQRTYLPVVPITSACNLDCPICYTINRNDQAYYMPVSEFEQILDSVQRNNPGLKLINFTGGEPTLHPQLSDIIRLCHEAGIARTTISTHGMTFLRNEELLAELAELDARIVLSFNSFEAEAWRNMVGSNVLKPKLKVLELLEKYKVDTTLIPVLALGCNEHEIGRLVEFTLQKDFIRSLEIHTMTFTGQGGTGFTAGSRLTTPDVLKLIEVASNKRIVMQDFIPSPCAHPLCYQTCYLLQTEDQAYIPFARFMPRETIRALLSGNLYIEPDARMETALQDAIMALWSGELPSATADRVLSTLKTLLKKLFPARPVAYAEQQRIAERAAKTIYIHSHMDDHNFDTDRIRQCCVGVPEADGGNIPTCAYNILYRGRDERFATRPEAPLAQLGGGRFYAL